MYNNIHVPNLNSFISSCFINSDGTLIDSEWFILAFCFIMFIAYGILHAQSNTISFVLGFCPLVRGRLGTVEQTDGCNA